MSIRDEAILMLDKRGALLETARTVSALLKQHHLRGAVIGGVAVVLHGHLRTTRDVDILIDDPSAFRAACDDAGIRFDARKREFLIDAVPVHLVRAEMVKPAPSDFMEIEGITTVGLADLISMKLLSGTRNLVRAQDIADVIGLIRARRLRGAFAVKVDSAVRAEFRKLLSAVKDEQS